MLKEKLNKGSETWTTVQFCPVFLEKDGKNHAALMKSISPQGMNIKQCAMISGDSLNSGDTVIFEVKTPYGRSGKYCGRICELYGEKPQNCYIDFSNTIFGSDDPIMSLIDSPF